MGDFCMPALGADMDAGTVAEWRVGPGDRVARGDIVAVVETDKADLDVEVFEGGVVTELLVPVGERVPVGTPLARITSAAGDRPAVAAPVQPVVPVEPAVAVSLSERIPVTMVASAPSSHAADTAAQPLVGPLIRHLADAEHVDLHHVHGSGARGRITRADVAAAAAAEATRGEGRARITPRARRLARQLGVALDDLGGVGGHVVTGADVERRAAASTVPPAPARRSTEQRGTRRAAIARLMSRAAREVPHYYVATRIPLSATMRWLDDHNAQVPLRDRLLPAALLLRAVASAAVAVPELNGEWHDDAFRPADGVHLGVAVAMRDGGLLTPTIRAADRKDLTTLMGDLRDLVTRARSGHLRPSELTGASLTVTNLGEQGVDTVFGVIVPPQVALVGFGAIRDEAWADHGMVGACPVIHASLAADHRATDGRVGARFLDVVGDVLQRPEEL
jgi:pyruvate dehydrogenase E2 component (dihydrolipoamide acetyltransferase)